VIPATGTLLPGRYKHVRLFVTDATIFLNTQIVTPAGDTLKTGVGIPVKIPSADSTGAASPQQHDARRRESRRALVLPGGGAYSARIFSASSWSTSVT